MLVVGHPKDKVIYAKSRPNLLDLGGQIWILISVLMLVFQVSKINLGERVQKLFLHYIYFCWCLSTLSLAINAKIPCRDLRSGSTGFTKEPEIWIYHVYKETWGSSPSILVSLVEFLQEVAPAVPIISSGLPKPFCTIIFISVIHTFLGLSLDFHWSQWDFQFRKVEFHRIRRN